MVRILLVSGGHAMLPFLKEAKSLEADGALIDRCRSLWYSGMTPEYLVGVYSHSEITISLAKI